MNCTFSIIGENESEIHTQISDKGSKLFSFKEVFVLWQHNPEFVANYIENINNLGFDEIYWEHPPLTQSDLERPYEVKIIKTNAFSSREINTRAFAEHLDKTERVVSFYNLGKDARLVVPTKKSALEDYKHLGAVLKNAPLEQKQELFQLIGQEILTELQLGKRIWLSTAGLGVIWLHIRLDTRPKYYKTQIFKTSDYFVS